MASYWARSKYWLLPVLTSLVWLVDLTGLLALWAREGYPNYHPWLGKLVYISNIAAATPTQHGFFMVFSIATACLYMATVLAVHRFRRERRIPSADHKVASLCGWAFLACTGAGCTVLAVLAVMDATNYPSFHWSCTISFIVFICVAVFFQCCEMFSIAYTYRYRSQRTFHALVWNGVFKLFVLLGSIVLAIVFAVMYLRCDGDARKDWHPDCERSLTLSAAAEWAIALGFVLLILSHIADMWDARYRLDPTEAYQQRLLPVDSLDTESEDEFDRDPEHQDGTPLQDSLAWSTRPAYMSVPLGSDDSLDHSTPVPKGHEHADNP